MTLTRSHPVKQSQAHGHEARDESGAEPRIALTNTTGAPLLVTGSQGGDGDGRLNADLGPHQTKVLGRDDIGGDAANGEPRLLRLHHNGTPGALMVTGFVVDEDTGFSGNLPFVDPRTPVSNKLAGAHFRIGAPNASEGFPKGTRFSAPLVLANTGSQGTRATVSLDYTLNSASHHVQIGTVNIDPGDTEQVDLAQALAERGVTGPLDDAGVDVTYDGAPGTVIGRLASFDQTQDYSFDVPVKDPLSGVNRVTGNYPWRLDSGFKTVVHLKNTLDQTVYALVQIRWAGGGKYDPGLVHLDPFQTVAVDIGALRDSQKPDLKGVVIPRDTAGGEVIWYERTIGSLIGRAEVANIDDAIASNFSCNGNQCSSAGLQTTGMTPSQATLDIGNTSAPFTPTETDQDCSGDTYLVAPSGVITWSSSNPSVATVDGSGNVTAVTDGTVAITANWSAPIPICNCSTPQQNQPVGAGASLTSQHSCSIVDDGGTISEIHGGCSPQSQYTAKGVFKITDIPANTPTLAASTTASNTVNANIQFVQTAHITDTQQSGSSLIVTVSCTFTISTPCVQNSFQINLGAKCEDGSQVAASHTVMETCDDGTCK